MLRVGSLVAVVGQACHEPASPIAMATAPVLDVPPLAPGPDAGSRTSDGVRFGHPVPRTGMAWRVTVHASSRSNDPQGGEQVSTYESELRVEVVAVDGPAPSRVRMKFLRNVQTYQGQEKATVVDGKEYFVDARAPHVRDAADAPAPEAEAQRVLDVFPDLGTRTRIDEVLPDDAMRVGERRDELAAAVLRVIHPRAWTLHAGTATLARATGEHAIFKLTLDASSDGGLRMSLAGEAVVSLGDAQLAELSLDGSYETKKDAGGAEPPGTFSLRRTVTSDPSPRNDR
jgi:hypothetical protein